MQSFVHKIRSKLKYSTIIYSYNTVSARCYKECPARPVYGLTIPVGLLKCMQPKRVQTHERSKGVQPFKVACIAAGQREEWDHVQARPGTPEGILQTQCYMVFFVLQSEIQSILLNTQMKNKWTHMTKAPVMLCGSVCFLPACSRVIVRLAVTLSACALAIGMHFC